MVTISQPDLWSWHCRQPGEGEPGFGGTGSPLWPLACVEEGLRDHDSGE